ncbi:hypothetical protein AB4Z50_14135 [Paenibacillus sp. 2TAB26]|uniref:hypothetical protein n=1 Tax=Paenibacillus sp. 2TAB26 TaxID=3233005 RepID=UPI003F9C4CD9
MAKSLFKWLLSMSLLLSIIGCQKENLITSITASSITITDKEHSNDNSHYWIYAYDSNNKQEKNILKLEVKEVMVWNLITIGDEYYASYSVYKAGTSGVLDDIGPIDSKSNE